MKEFEICNLKTRSQFLSKFRNFKIKRRDIEVNLPAAPVYSESFETWSMVLI